MNLFNLHIRNLSGLSMLIFGVLALVLGLIGLIHPETTLNLLQFEALDRARRVNGDFTLTFLIASLMLHSIWVSTMFWRHLITCDNFTSGQFLFVW